jgi:hypothetical protein
LANHDKDSIGPNQRVRKKPGQPMGGSTSTRQGWRNDVRFTDTSLLQVLDWGAFRYKIGEIYTKLPFYRILTGT